MPVLPKNKAISKAEAGNIRPGKSDDNLNKGIALMVAGLLILPSIDAIAKHLSDSITALQITWARFLFQSGLMAALVFLQKPVVPLLPKRPLVHLVRGVLLAIATLLFFWSLKYLPIADAIAIFFVQPLILTALSSFFLGETVGWHRKLAVVAGLLGAIIIIQPGRESFHTAALLPLAAAFFYAGYIVLTRAAAGQDKAETAQFAAGISAFTVLSVCLVVVSATPLEALHPVAPNFVEWSWLALLGVIAASCHLLLVKATELAPASVLAPFAYTEFVGAALLGWIFFNDVPSAATWLGTIIIVLSGLYVFLRERQLSRQTTAGQC